ncbi:TetR/AcrR family transcriptional regulator [Pedobacter sp. ASV28]|uniref:TetR/AcrR family transcriptional regulator n=1 Tax=Pedobacter sp. ASV28 TaxID=2795123 RepID=UPI0018ED5236|nr:TetR/AcrR family transcriptional regulator [Pedobacter sp. ASV28]
MNNCSRKYDGPIKSKERTSQKILDAVGEIIKEKGYAGLKIKNVAERAKVNRKTLYDCFGNFDNLVETYIKRKDYYMSFRDQADQLVNKYNKESARELVQTLLVGQLENFSTDKEMQKILLWHLSEDNPLLLAINEERERIGGKFMELSIEEFAGTNVDIRLRIGLLIGGIYQLVYNAKKEKGLFCGIDLANKDTLDRLRLTLIQMIGEAFEKGKHP